MFRITQKIGGGDKAVLNSALFCWHPLAGFYNVACAISSFLLAIEFSNLSMASGELRITATVRATLNK